MSSASYASDVTTIMTEAFQAICIASDVVEAAYADLSKSNGWEVLDTAAFADATVQSSYAKLIGYDPIASTFGTAKDSGQPYCSIQAMQADINALSEWVNSTLNVLGEEVIPGMVIKTVYDVEIESAPSVKTVTVQFAFGAISLIASR
ncbi:hypothetical protein [Roseovarius albus]|nr:hypothetical protein [Roseovarius albus]